MAGEDLLESGGDSSPSESDTKGKKKKPLSKGQKIGVGIGVVTILLVIWQIKKSQAANASSTTTAPIDPQTGYPSGSAEDQAALAQLSGGGLYGNQGSGTYGADTGQTSTVSGNDPVTGMTYSAEIAQNAGGISTLQSDFTQLQGSITSLTSDVQGLSTNANQTYQQPYQSNPTPTPTSTTPTPTPTPTSHLPTLATAEARIATTKKDIAAAQKGGPADASKLASAKATLATQTATLNKVKAQG